MKAINRSYAIDYPKAKRDAFVDQFGDVAVEDPYRWLEYLDSKETQDWIHAENQLGSAYLHGLPMRDWFQATQVRLRPSERPGIIERRGGKYFFSKWDSENRPSLYDSEKPYATDARCLVSSEEIAKRGNGRLSGWRADPFGISPDGRLVAYGVVYPGVGFQQWKFRDVESGTDLPDSLKWIKYTPLKFGADSRTVFYSSYPEPETKFKDANQFNKLFSHSLGTRQSQDCLLLQAPDHKDWSFGAELSDDGHFLLVSICRNANAENLFFYKDLRGSNASFVHLINAWNGQFTYLALQAAQAQGGPPILLKVKSEGHGGAAFTDDLGDEFAFAWENTADD